MGRTPALFAAIVATLVLTSACGGGGAEPTPTPEPSPSPEPTATPSSGDLAQSVVQIAALDAADEIVWTGSGTVISSDGLILTNGHVVDNRAGDYDALGVAVTERTDQPPEPTYIAEIAAVDYVLDLAVIRVVSDLDGASVSPELPTIPLGDSESVDIGDHIRILGFPGIGGETITFTEGSISGFTSQRDIADRAWIKTDATISGGNSGGLAANEAGQIIGVPTIAGAGRDVGEPVDCRYVVDTNRDGTIDDADNCVPVGGFINGLRPIALALPLIEAAEADETYVSAYPEPDLGPVGAFDPAMAAFGNLVFSDGVTESDEPTEIVQALPAGATDACAFWEYEGMADGVSWEALWFVDGELNEQGSIIGDVWVGGEAGIWWVCTYDDMGLAPGLYELVLNVEGEFMTTDSLYVGGDHPLVEVGIENASLSTVCYLFLSPTDAENWGQDELGPQEMIEPGFSTTIFIPAGFYDLMVLDCDENVLLEEYELDGTDGGVITVE